MLEAIYITLIAFFSSLATTIVTNFFNKKYKLNEVISELKKARESKNLEDLKKSLELYNEYLKRSMNSFLFSAIVSLPAIIIVLIFFSKVNVLTLPNGLKINGLIFYVIISIIFSIILKYGKMFKM